MSSTKQNCKKTWQGTAEFTATKEFDSVQVAAETDSPGDNAKIEVLDLKYTKSSIKLTKETDEQFKGASIQKTGQGT
jgi:hypothetical protein|tara:strand:+ start:35 stop:265 length:231 start_codon:yes stop_codon:yes gene_type:complete